MTKTTLTFFRKMSGGTNFSKAHTIRGEEATNEILRNLTLPVCLVSHQTDTIFPTKYTAFLNC